MRVSPYFFGVACSALLSSAATPTPDLIAKIPLSFTEATEHKGRYLLRGPGYGAQIEAREMALSFLTSKPSSSKTGSALRARFVKPLKSARIHAEEPLASITSYFIGPPRNWRAGIINYGKVRVDGLYAGIDLVYYGSDGELEYDFVVHPGADPKAIRFEISGSDAIRLDKNGDLLITTGGYDLRWKAPVLYQTSAGARVPIEGRYRLTRSHEVRFETGKYDPARELTIDPVLAYTSYVGGTAREWSRALATDASGNVYITGLTSSLDLAVTANAPQVSFAGKNGLGMLHGDAFVAKFNPAGALVYLAYLGGKLDEFGFSITADAAGNAYVTGVTNSQDFPVTQGAYQTVFGGSGGNLCERAGDAFVTKINPAGTQLVYSTYLGGRQDDFGAAIAIDPSGNAYVTGFTISNDFPVTDGVYQTALAGLGGQIGRPPCGGRPWFNTGDAFVTKLNPAGSQLVFSTYVGGGSDDAATAIALDASQNVFIGGFTMSRTFPTTAGALQRTYGGSDIQNFFFITGDGFVTKLNSTGTSLVYSTYLGGVGEDGVTGLAIAADGTAWATGATSSQNFPVSTNARQKGYAGYFNLPFEVEQLTGDAFITHLNAGGTGVIYSSFLGGTKNDLGGAIRIDPSGLVYVSGFTDSADFPVTANAVQKTFGGDGFCNSFPVRLCGTQYFQFGDGFITVLDPAAPSVIYSTFLGGTRDDTLLGMALDGNGGVWAGGGTHSDNNPAAGSASQKAIAGRTDSWLVHLTGTGVTGPALSAVTNAASNAVGAVSPGMIWVGYGSLIGPATLVGAALDTSGKLATNVAGVTMTFDGALSPIVYVSATQVAGVVPYSVAGKTSTQVVVNFNGQSSAPLTVPVVAAAPGIFSANFSGTGPAVAFNQDNSLNSAARPAAKGSVVVLFGTGEGQTTPAGVDGFIAIPGSLATPNLGCSATVGGVTASVLYCGSVPFVVDGELQVNLQLGANTPSGSQPVVVSVGTFKSQAGLTIFVQ